MLKNRKLYELTATEAILKIKNEETTVTELINAYIERIEIIEPNIKAWEYFNKEHALAQARIIDKKIENKEKIGNLYGLPVGIKDIFNTIGMPTGMGSDIWKNFTPGNDARAVEYLRWADGIILGKTVTAEFAVHHPGPTVNPHNYNHSPGTSSSGSAAAVASNMVPLALGSQTAGSTIRPSSYCGVFGMKPSFGLIPRTGILKTLDTLDHVSFMSRSVDDLKLLLDVLRVKGANFPFVHQKMDKGMRTNRSKGEKWRVAFVKTPAWENAYDYAQEAICDFVEKLEALDMVTVESVELPEEFSKAHDIHDTIYTKALSYYFMEEYEKHRDKISDEFCQLVENGKKIQKREYIDGLESQRQLNSLLEHFLGDKDIIITLSTAGEAMKGLHTPDIKDSCLIWTLCHVPAISLPAFKGPNGLPFGAQIVSSRYRDYDLLAFAGMLEREGLIQY